MSGSKVTIILLTAILLFSVSGCSGNDYDDKSLNMASLFSRRQGGVSVLENENYKDLARDIFELKTQFEDKNTNSLDTDKDMQSWYTHLHDGLENLQLNNMSRYYVYDISFLATFKQIYDIADTADDLWDDHDYDGSPNWNDPDYQVFQREGCK